MNKNKKLMDSELIELYDLIYPKSLEDEDYMKVIEMKKILDGEELALVFIDKLKIMSEWLIIKGYWS
jgi:hypothetical protein